MIHYGGVYAKSQIIPGDNAMTEHGALTVVARIKPERMQQLQEVLDAINANVETNSVLPFKKLTSIHFARFVILDEAVDLHGNRIPVQLVFSSNYDAPLANHIQDLLKNAASGLDKIFSHCEGYPLPNGSPNRIENFICSHMVDYEAFYIGTRARSVTQIHQEAELHDAIENFLDQDKCIKKEATVFLRSEIQKHINSILSIFSWILPVPDPYEKKVNKIFLRAVLIFALAFSFLTYFTSFGTALMCVGVPIALLLLSGLIVIPILRMKEKKDIEENVQPDKKLVQNLLLGEDHIVQNQLTHLVNIKPGLFRLVLLKIVLKTINALAQLYYYKGDLGGIPSIHFARWIIIDQGRRLLFVSNFDGSWENYLGDFIDKAATGLTGVWSNTVGFPKTSFLLFKGATDEQRFKNWARNHQIPTQVWYSAYTQLTVTNINNNSAIRAGLFGEMDEGSIRKWLQRF